MGVAKYTAEEINHLVRTYFAECKQLRRIPNRPQLASYMKLTTRTLWNYRDKYPDVFEEMDKYAIKEFVGKTINKPAPASEKMMMKLLRWYKPYFQDVNPALETLPEELAEMIQDPFKRYIMKLGMQVGMKFSIK